MGYALPQLSGRVIEAAIVGHRDPGLGLSESITSPKFSSKRVVLDYHTPSAHREG